MELKVELIFFHNSRFRIVSDRAVSCQQDMSATKNSEDEMSCNAELGRSQHAYGSNQNFPGNASRGVSQLTIMRVGN